MVNRETYFVSPKGDVFPFKTDVALQLFEIQATDEEINRFKLAVQAFDSSEDVEKEDFFNMTHFNESVVDEHRRMTYSKLLEIYKWIYTLGTPRTKLEIEKLNILPSLDEKPTHY